MTSGAWIFKGHGATYYVHYRVINGQNGFILRLHSLKALKVHLLTYQVLKK